jgi:hypothetical protein
MVRIREPLSETAPGAVASKQIELPARIWTAGKWRRVITRRLAAISFRLLALSAPAHVRAQHRRKHLKLASVEVPDGPLIKIIGASLAFFVLPSLLGLGSTARKFFHPFDEQAERPQQRCYLAPVCDCFGKTPIKILRTFIHLI